MNNIPKGYKQIPASVYVNMETGKVIVTAEPWNIWPEEVCESEDQPHDCDMCGCGWEHVVAEGNLLVVKTTTTN